MLGQLANGAKLCERDTYFRSGAGHVLQAYHDRRAGIFISPVDSARNPLATGLRSRTQVISWMENEIVSAENLCSRKLISKSRDGLSVSLILGACHIDQVVDVNHNRF